MKTIISIIILLGLALAVLDHIRQKRTPGACNELCREEDIRYKVSQSKGIAVQPLVKKAVEHITALNITPGVAIDFGPGFGLETSYLLKQGYQVIAIDNFKEGLDFLVSQKDIQPYRTKLRTLHANFEDLDWSAIPQIDLFVASFSLPQKVHAFPNFPKLWEHIVDHIRTGGFLVADLPTLPKEELLIMLKDFDIHYFAETMELYGGGTATNELPTDEKTYAVIARKK